MSLRFLITTAIIGITLFKKVYVLYLMHGISWQLMLGLGTAVVITGITWQMMKVLCTEK